MKYFGIKKTKSDMTTKQCVILDWILDQKEILCKKITKDSIRKISDI